MKKILTSICFLIIIASAAFANGNVGSPSKNVLKNVSISTMKNFKLIQTKADDCTVTVTGSVGVGSTSLSVSCSATASTCDAASNQAIGCVSGAIKKIRAML